MFYIIATPIGNLKDITIRAIETLQQCDWIYCEDTRRSQILLNHYQIKKPIKALHKFKEKVLIEEIIQLLQTEKQVALISDAGMPLISDPGSFLVSALIEKQLPFTCLPGPSSVINALVLSGFDTCPFQFLGFLPKKSGEKKQTLLTALTYPGCSICFETKERIKNTLQLFETLAPNQHLCLVKELTKTFETAFRGKATDILAQLPTNPLGEFILIIHQETSKTPFDGIGLARHLKFIQESLGCSEKQAIKIAAKMRSETKSDLYNQIFMK